MKIDRPIEEIEQEAKDMLSQIPGLKKIVDLDMPGRFIYSPPDSSRICVKSLAELHEVRTALRKNFGWRDYLDNKFFSCGVVIVTYRPKEGANLPLPFSIWVESPPESFPEELLGGCKLEKFEETHYSIVCPVEGR